MTIQHTVVFRLVHDSGSSAEAEFLDTAKGTLTAIAGVTEFSINRQVSPKSDLDWQFSMLFADQAAYDATTPTRPTSASSRRGGRWRWTPSRSTTSSPGEPADGRGC